MKYKANSILTPTIKSYKNKNKSVRRIAIIEFLLIRLKLRIRLYIINFFSFSLHHRCCRYHKTIRIFLDLYLFISFLSFIQKSIFQFFTLETIQFVHISSAMAFFREFNWMIFSRLQRGNILRGDDHFNEIVWKL